MRSVGWFAVDMSSAIAAWIYIVRIEEVEGMMGNTLDSRLGRTSPQGSLTGSAKGEGIFQSSRLCTWRRLQIWQGSVMQEG